MAQLSRTGNMPLDNQAKSKQAIDRYIRAATRENTRRSYQGAIEHFEVSWGGFLPSTADQVAMYLADHAEELAVSTLRQRLAAIATWHKEQGFPDPTKASVVKKVLKGIKELHPEAPKSAKPLQIEELARLDIWLRARIQDAVEQEDRSQELIYLRNRALILVGFWRGFRSDELCRMTVENTQAIDGKGLTIFLPRSKGDRESIGTTHKTPALRQLCPVSAYSDWIKSAEITSGPVFRSINRWGQLAEKPLHPNSIIALLKTLLESAGFEDAKEFSSHSLRRGFASWASDNQWDLKTLMEYVGWKDVKSAMRYIETTNTFGNVAYLSMPKGDDIEITKTATIEVKLTIQRYHKGLRTMKKTRDIIERFCLKTHNPKALNKDRTRYELKIKHDSDKHLNKIIDELLIEMHQIAHDNQCLLDLSFADPSSGKRWD